MIWSVVFLLTWWLILLLGGIGINHLAVLSGVDIITSGVSILVIILQIIGVVISLFIFLLYCWSVKKSLQLETYCRKKKKCIKCGAHEVKTNINTTIDNTKTNVKHWYDKKWWAIENIQD